MSGAPPPTGDADDAETRSEAGEPPAGDQVRAAAALREAFTRLAPQGSDAWNFLAAFTHLGDRYGPYHPGASALSDAVSASRTEGRRTGALDRLRPRRDRCPRPGDGNGEKTELEEAMGHVVEAFRFLSARVETLEARLAAQDRPVEGAAWLVPARELGAWAEPDRGTRAGVHTGWRDRPRGLRGGRAACTRLRAARRGRARRGAARRAWRSAPLSRAAR